MSRSRLLRSVLICAALVSASPVFAQTPTPVVLVHGWNSDGTTWNSTAGLLSSTGNYSPYAVNLDWSESLYPQATVVASAPGFGPSGVLVGHSQGGLVSRLASRSGPVFGIITIGSPHNGAPIAGAGAAILLDLALTNWDFLTGYDDLQDACDPEYDDLCLNSTEALDYIAPAFELVENALGIGVAYFGTAWQDLSDLQPGSNVILDLQNNYNQEQTGGHRTSIVADDNLEYTGPFRLFESVNQSVADAQTASNFGSILIFAGEEILDGDDPDTDPNYDEHQEGGSAVQDLGAFIYDLCPFIWNVQFVGSTANDGFVPTSSQTMPNSDRVFQLQNVAHTEETNQAGTIRNELDRMTNR